jgi:hypothetical protein
MQNTTSQRGRVSGGNYIELIIGIGWWNTSLSPRGKRHATDEDKQFASEVTNLLIDTLGIDCLSFGEVTSDDLNYLFEKCHNANYAIFDGTQKEGRLQFDTGLIYNKQRLQITDSVNITYNDRDRSLRVAQRIDFKTSETLEPLHLYVLHWPRSLGHD